MSTTEPSAPQNARTPASGLQARPGTPRRLTAHELSAWLRGVPALATIWCYEEPGGKLEGITAVHEHTAMEISVWPK